ncbi:MAG: transcription antitermination factor NusB [Clostridia bacterium]|nr:transcription antitermination factor NusB [Clostridia bacterium]
MSRRDAREVAFKMVFEYSFNKNENTNILEEYTAEMVADDVAYVKEVYFGVTSHYDELMEKVSANAEKFSADRLFKVDLAILLLAIYEITYVSSIPFKVFVDEALNLAKKYSTEKSAKYINGVLAKFAR